jgi:competence protein ComEC
MGGCALAGDLALAAVASLAWLTPPDMLISGDGRTVGITGIPGRSLVILRDGQGAFARDTMLETAGMTGVATPWPNGPPPAVQLWPVRSPWSVAVARGRF